MILATVAVLAYGILAIVAALVVAAISGSPTGAALAFAAAGLTYLFQLLELQAQVNGARTAGSIRLQAVLWALIVGALLLSPIVSLWS